MSKDKILAIKNSLLISMEKVIFPSVTFSILKTLFVKDISVLFSSERLFTYNTISLPGSGQRVIFLTPPPPFSKILCVLRI